MGNDIIEKAKNALDRLLEGKSSINQIRNEFGLKSIDDKLLNECCRRVLVESNCGRMKGLKVDHSKGVRDVLLLLEVQGVEINGNYIEIEEELVRRLNEYDELMEQLDTLSDTVNILSPLMMKCHDLKALNRDFVQLLKECHDKLNGWNREDHQLQNRIMAAIEKAKVVE
ncbi:MAG: hypothetical protein K0R93_710 [Anaerosolibacter sp.]|jgi:hypothetical protein|uniref:hypothetical protein n=1 Tax=Anaerosolibacter sp. TaxID=1872527 RepID=UPI00260C41A0|nr:hypothetical protein [Anaerosolibacter sp.]MDF2545812.1 hypothetical protein [Anaerosolibacter sp.]